MALKNPKYMQLCSTSDDPENLHSVLQEKENKPPWNDWNLNEEFLRSLSDYSKAHPENILDSVLDRVYNCINSNQNFFTAIPDSPFPAQSLVMALGFLLTLGITVKKARDEAYEFAKQVVNWVVQMQLAFESTEMQNTEYTLLTWESLGKNRELIDEICLWAHSRLKYRRWARIKSSFVIRQEIEDFNKRLQNSKELFRDFSVLHLQGGMSAILSRLRSFLSRQNEILNEIREMKSKQLENLIFEIEESKSRNDRKEFLEKHLASHTVTMFAYDTQGKLPCDEGTRIKELEDITNWLYSISTDSHSILWLTGDPGCGKSAIAATLATRCKDEGILCAQLFINRNIVQTTDPNSFFPTISRQLAEFSPAVEKAIHDRLKARPSLADRMTQDQAIQLFSDALAVAASLDKDSVVAVIIDGLDEIEKKNLLDAASILSHLFETLSKFPNIKVFISSRSEDEIRQPFEQKMQSAKVKLVCLDTALSKKDVSSYLRKQLEKIANDYNLNKDEWPTQQQLEKLDIRASGLFIWAVTAVIYINERISEDGSGCVESVVDELIGDALMEINELYTLILQSTLTKHHKRNAWNLEKFRRIVGAVVVLRQPLSLHDLSGLLDIRGGPQNTPVDVVNFVRRHRTVLVSGIEAIDEKTIPRLHSSFVEFIINQDMFAHGLSLRGGFYVDPVIAEAELASSCLKRISGTFKEKGTAALRGGLEYAFQFGFSHASAVGKEMESCIALVLPDAKTKVEDVRSRIAAQQCGTLTPWFPLDYDRPPPAPFSPLTAAYRPPQEGVPPSRLLTHTVDFIYCLAYSPDGEKLVTSFSREFSLILWNVRTGAEILMLEGHTDVVPGLAFSPSGERIVSVSEDGTACVWDAGTGRLVTTIDLQNKWGNCVKYSCDGQILAISSSNGTVCLYDANSGESISAPLHHYEDNNIDDEVFDVVFTPDEELIISNSFSYLYIWDRKTSECRKQVEFPISKVQNVAISPSGDRLVALGDQETCFFKRSTEGFEIEERLSSKAHFYASQASFYPDNKSILFRNVTLSENGEKFYFAGYDLASRTLYPIIGPDEYSYYSALSLCGSFVAFSYGQQIHITTLPQLRPITLTILSPNGDMAACVFSEGTVWLASPKALPAVRKKLEGKVGKVTHLALNSDNVLLAGVDDEFLYLWDVSTQKLRGSAPCKDLPPVTELSFLEDRCNIITLHENQSVITWSTDNGTLQPCATPSTELVRDSKVLLDFDEDSVYELGGARFYLGKKEGQNFGFWVYMDDSLMKVRPDKSVTLLPLN